MIWLEIERDAQALVDGAGDGVLASPLWPDGVPRAFREDIRKFSESLKALGPHWEVIRVWYEQVLKDATVDPFPNKVLDAIANEESDFWGDGDDNPRTPDTVMADIAERLGWPPDKPKPSMTAFIVKYLDQAQEPVSIDQFVAAFAEAGYDSPRSSIRGRLNSLTSDKRIQRVGRGLYAALKGSARDNWPQEAKDVKSPFEYGWNSDGKIELTGDALGRVLTPEYRSPEDAKNRLEAARQLAKSLAQKIRSGDFQAGVQYASDLESYAQQLPNEAGGNIYLADSTLRTLRDDLADDLGLGYVDDRFARRLLRVIEAHYGVRVYYPDLQGLYDDVKRGELTEPPPLMAMQQLTEVVDEFTPDVFDESVIETVDQKSWPTFESSKEEATEAQSVADSSVQLPPDPIADVDPVRADQAARAGAFNRLWSILRKTENASKNIERAEKAADVFARNIDEIISWFSKLGG